MKLVMTLLARDEADVVDAHLAFHLNAGVDFVIATDHASRDATTEILERYAREGYAHVIREESREYRQADAVTRMARLAATEYGADWVLNSDADEFWWPRGLDLKDVLAATPRKYGVLQSFVRHFVPRPDDGSPFFERSTVRLAATAPINDAASPWRPYAKVIHRGDPRIVVSAGNHMVLEPRLQPFRGWYPIEVLHFPWRSLDQVAHKAKLQWDGFQTGPRPPTAYHSRAYQAVESGSVADYYGWLAVDDDELERGLAERTLVVDTRLRDALRSLTAQGGEDGRFALPAGGASRLELARPSVVDDAAFAVDAGVLREAELVRAQRTLDELEARVAHLEGGLGPRTMRTLRRVVRRSTA